MGGRGEGRGGVGARGVRQSWWRFERIASVSEGEDGGVESCGWRRRRVSDTWRRRRVSIATRRIDYRD